MRLAPQTSYSSSHTLEQAVGAPDDAAKRFGRSALLNAAATERAGLRDEKNEGVACPPWWLPPFMANHGQAHTGNQVARADFDDGKPHRDLISHQPADQPTPDDSPLRVHPSSEFFYTFMHPLPLIAKGCKTLALLCVLLFLLSSYALNGKVSDCPSVRTPCALFFALRAIAATCV